MTSTISASETSCISPSTITMLSIVPAMIQSISDSSISLSVGLITNSPLILPTLTSDIGPLNGISDIAIHEDAAKPTNASGLLTPS